MVEVVGKDSSVSKSVTCFNCGSMLEYYKWEVNYTIRTDYTGDVDRIAHIKCPACRATITELK